MNRIELLASHLNSLGQIPEVKRRERSLMDITGIRHHENMWSDIYKFFFVPTEKHGLGDVFIRSLESIIGVSNFLEDFSVKREFVTDANKKIDLLLRDNRNKRAIIIENKVYHTLNNDLNHYQAYLQKKGFQDIKTIVLGLRKYNLKRKRTNQIKDSDLFSITHQELMKKVQSCLKSCPNAHPQHLYLLNEFATNIKNLTHMIDPEIADFFSIAGNREKILAVHRVYNEVENYITSIMECKEKSELSDILKRRKIEVKAQGNFVKYIFPNTSERIMFTVFYRDKIMHAVNEQPHIHWVLEVQGEAKDKVLRDVDNKKALIQEYSEGKIKFAGRERNNWLHFAAQTIVLDDLSQQLPILPAIMAEQFAEDAPMMKLAKALIESIK